MLCKEVYVLVSLLKLLGGVVFGRGELVEAFKSKVTTQHLHIRGYWSIIITVALFCVSFPVVFNAIISLCLKGVHPMLENVLKLDEKAVKRYDQCFF